MPIQFEIVKREAHLLSPLANFSLASQTIEHRRDPLTGRSVIVLPSRLEYVKRFVESEETFIQEMANQQKETCPFCPASINSKAPKFVSDIAPEGRITVGEAVCFPSLFAHEDFNALVVISGSHNLQLNQISPEMFANAFKACTQYFIRLHNSMPAAKYNAIMMNFLPPAGSTLSHPHIHAVASDLPFAEAGRLLDASKSYFARNGSSYWADLLETERSLGVRYLGKIRGVDWLTPYAPMGLNECQAIIHGTATVDGLSDDSLKGLSEGLSRILGFYYETGVRSFNFAIYSAPFGESLGYFDVGLRVVSRYGYKPRFVSDTWAFQYLLGEQEVYEAPEETCVKLKKYFP